VRLSDADISHLNTSFTRAEGLLSGDIFIDSWNIVFRALDDAVASEPNVVTVKAQQVTVTDDNRLIPAGDSIKVSLVYGNPTKVVADWRDLVRMFSIPS
jgi:hypothetical protein